MNPRNTVLRLLLACGVVIGVVVSARHNSEPVYQGKTLKQWMQIYMWPGGNSRAEQDRRQREAAEAVRHIGSNAVPTLLEWEDKDARVPWKYKLYAQLPRSLQKQRLIDNWLIAADHYRVDRALFAFYILGSNALPAVPELTRRMMTRTSDSGVYAATALANMGGAAIPALSSALTNAKTPNRPWVARMLGNATHAASDDLSGVQLLSRCVQDPNPAVGATAAMELSLLTSKPELTVPALIQGLADPRGQVRLRSAHALSCYGPAGRPAVPALLRYLNDPDAFVRRNVTNALQQIAPESLQTNAVPQ